MNQIVLVGRLVGDPAIKKLENEGKASTITLAVPRSFKNIDGIYETDFIPVILWNGIATNTCEYCHTGDVVAVKGRIQTKDNQIQIIAEKLTFLSNGKED